MEVIRQKGDLEREVWAFWLNGERGAIELVLDGWFLETRETKRRKFRSEEYWKRTYNDRLAVRNPPQIPADVAAEALELARSRVAFAPGKYGWNGTVEGEQ